MSLRRLISVLSVVAMASGVALAQPNKSAPPAPAKEPDPSATPAVGEGSAVTPIEDAAPADMEGTSENPDAPRGSEDVSISSGPIAPTTTVGYPIEQARRPIVLPETMAEVSIAPHFQATPSASDALRARYGITNKVQLGVTYVYGGVYDDRATMKKAYAFHVGKAAGLDVTVLLQNWVAVRIGVPVYFDPFAMGIQLDAPMKFRINDKFALGALDDFLNIALPVGAEFAPDFYQESRNADAANREMTGSTQSRGRIRVSGFAEYQYKPDLALIGRLAFDIDDFSTNRNNAGFGGIETRIHAGVQYTPAKWLDVGAQLGWDDLSKLDTFGLQGFLALRI